MITREEVIQYIAERYAIQPEYIFEKFPSYCVFRHKHGKKWFGLIMTIPQNKLYGDEGKKIEIIDLKIDPELGEILRNKKGYHQAYHMNKEHWITLDLSSINNFSEIAELIDSSFNLTL